MKQYDRRLSNYQLVDPPDRLLSRWVAALALAGVGPLAYGQSTVIDIPAPLGSQWTQVVIQDEGPAIMRASTRNAGNNEIGKWNMEYVISASTEPHTNANSLALIYALQTYDPAVQGAVDRIDVSMGLFGVLSNFANKSVGGVRPVVQQDGQIYSVSGSTIGIFQGVVQGVLPPTTWSLLATDNWVRRDTSTGLDLSVSGSPIQFGLRWDLNANCSGQNGCSAAGIVLQVDALRFTIHPMAAAVPEPATWGMLLAGVLLLGSVSRRRVGADQAG